MKKTLLTLAVALLGMTALAQTTEEIISRMEAALDAHESEGVIMTVSTKIPVLGTVTMKTYTLGDKMRSESTLMGVDVITFTDGVTEWTYTPKNNKVKITDDKSGDSSEEGDVEMFSGITDGYDVNLTKETDDAWYFTCKKQKTNKNKDDPKTVELVIAKETYYPMLLKTKMSGVTLILRDIAFGVKEEFVTFDINNYPGAVVEDARGEKK